MVKQLTTVSEFENWQVYFEERLAGHDKADYYHAALIRAVYASQGAKVSNKVADFLLDFELPKETKPENGSKGVWLSIFGIDPE